ncbi:hypothetical protein N9Y92_04180, partial [Chlamydiales bacterium]|nr:hypothetical protein [Chlamydiales bacterium]
SNEILLQKRSVFVGKVTFNDEGFTVENPKVLKNFAGNKNKFEKNWVPFDYKGNLLLSYTLNPHKVFLPKPEESSCETVSISEIQSDWEWGVLRGGTPAVKIDNDYLAFFHSSKIVSSLQSEKKMYHYFMGAYLYESEPPFKIKKMSQNVIVGEHFYQPPYYKTWKPLRVVFPMGLVVKDSSIYLSYGRQDHEMWILKMDKKQLLNSLKNVQSLDKELD